VSPSQHPIAASALSTWTALAVAALVFNPFGLVSAFGLASAIRALVQRRDPALRALPHAEVWFWLAMLGGGAVLAHLATWVQHWLALYG